MGHSDGDWDDEDPHFANAIPTEAVVDGRRAYQFNPETGILALNPEFVKGREKGIDDLVRQIGVIPPEGVNISYPMGFDMTSNFKGVKAIVYLPPEDRVVAQQTTPVSILDGYNGKGTGE